MRIDEDIVAADVGMIGRDVTDAAHVGREVVDLIDAAAGGQQAVFNLAQVENFHLVGGAGFVLRHLDVGAAHPVAVLLQTFNQVVADESSRTGYEYPLLLGHSDLVS